MVLIDESGFQLQPLVRRTWAPKGQTPVMANWDRHDRATAIAALAWTPATDTVEMFFELQSHNATATDFIGFLQRLHEELKRPLTIIWDRLGAHRKAARVLREIGVKWARFEWLPPYCPELNPVEHIWSTTKWGRLSNWPAEDIYHLAGGVHDDFTNQQTDDALLRGHFRAAGLGLDSVRRDQ